MLQDIPIVTWALAARLLLLLYASRCETAGPARLGGLIMPKTKLMVALRDSSSVEELIGLAGQLAAGMGGEVIAFHVVTVPMATPPSPQSSAE